MGGRYSDSRVWIGSLLFVSPMVLIRNQGIAGPQVATVTLTQSYFS